jgi:formylglycine-generating enzyme required for sulfatase activity
LEVITNSIGMKLALIPAGEFLMGSPETEEGRRDDEGPQHIVRITQPFYLGVYPVTQAEYEQVMGTNPSVFCSTGRYSSRVSGQDTSRFPVEQVSWEDAMEFCRRLSAQEGGQYSLPTEAQWEYACRGGAKDYAVFGIGDGKALTSKLANFHGAYSYGCNEKGPYLQRTTPVGSYKLANGFGLFDMHGNVWEWCSDWYGKYAPTTVDDPAGPATGSDRVFRGGGWSNYARYCRSAYRSRSTPDYRFNYLGFRLAFSSVDSSGR